MALHDDDKSFGQEMIQCASYRTVQKMCAGKPGSPIPESSKDSLESTAKAFLLRREQS